jgi:hypothetical protein
MHPSILTVSFLYTNIYMIFLYFLRVLDAEEHAGHQRLAALSSRDAEKVEVTSRKDHVLEGHE